MKNSTLRSLIARHLADLESIRNDFAFSRTFIFILDNNYYCQPVWDEELQLPFHYLIVQFRASATLSDYRIYDTYWDEVAEIKMYRGGWKARFYFAEEEGLFCHPEFLLTQPDGRPVSRQRYDSTELTDALNEFFETATEVSEKFSTWYDYEKSQRQKEAEKPFGWLNKRNKNAPKDDYSALDKYYREKLGIGKKGNRRNGR